MSNIDAVLAQLKQQRDQLNKAIAALEGVTAKSARTGRRTMSVAARRRIAAAQKARWARWRKRRNAA